MNPFIPFDCKYYNPNLQQKIEIYVTKLRIFSRKRNDCAFSFKSGAAAKDHRRGYAATASRKEKAAEDIDPSPAAILGV
jgi:hypothetical protein